MAQACVFTVVWQRTVVLDVETVLKMTGKNKLQITKVSYLFKFWLYFRKIEPSVFYKLFLIKRYVHSKTLCSTNDVYSHIGETCAQTFLVEIMGTQFLGKANELCVL